MNNKTPTLKLSKGKVTETPWVLVDATGITIGKLSTFVSSLLIGKDNPKFSNNIFCGKSVVVINSDKLKISEKKLSSKLYFFYSGFPGGLRKENLASMLTKDSTNVIMKSVKGMLPKNKMGSEMLRHLYVFKDEKHDKTPQSPVLLNIN